MLLVQPGATRRITTALLTGNDLARLPSGESIRHLDLDGYEDIDRVMIQASGTGPGRNPDPLDPEHVYSVLVNPEISQNELYRRFSIGRAKQKAVIDFAKSILAFMEQGNYRICGPESGTELKQNTDFDCVTLKSGCF